MGGPDLRGFGVSAERYLAEDIGEKGFARMSSNYQQSSAAGGEGVIGKVYMPEGPTVASGGPILAAM
jgi:hypothetical protein